MLYSGLLLRICWLSCCFCVGFLCGFYVAFICVYVGFIVGSSFGFYVGSIRALCVSDFGFHFVQIGFHVASVLALFWLRFVSICVVFVFLCWSY